MNRVCFSQNTTKRNRSHERSELNLHESASWRTSSIRPIKNNFLPVVGQVVRIKNSKLFIGFTLIACISFAGCKKHSRSETDIRESLVGTYTGNKQSTIQWSTLSSSFSDSTRNDNITFKVGIDSTATDGLVITESGPVGLPSLRYKANVVTATSVGLVFSIPQQTVPVVIDSIPLTIDIRGAKSYTLNNNVYDGGYTSATKKIIIGYTGTLQVTIQSITVNVPYASVNEGTRQ